MKSPMVRPYETCISALRALSFWKGQQAAEDQELSVGAPAFTRMPTFWARTLGKNHGYCRTRHACGTGGHFWCTSSQGFDIFKSCCGCSFFSVLASSLSCFLRDSLHQWQLNDKTAEGHVLEQHWDVKPRFYSEWNIYVRKPDMHAPVVSKEKNIRYGRN